MKIYVSQEAPWLLPLTNQDLHAAVACMLECAQAMFHELELYVVRDGRMAQENLRCMGCQGATNILSFPPAEGMPATLLLCADATRREALLYGQDLGEHCLRLLAHGLGHVLGHDHGPEMDTLCEAMLSRACARRAAQA